MDTKPENLAQQVFHRRRSLRLSQTRLAALAGISRNYLSMIERGQAQNVSLNVITGLAAALGTSPGTLTGESEQAQTFIPPALRTFAIRHNLRFDIVDRLARIPSRGHEPHTPEEWAELFAAVRPYL